MTSEYVIANESTEVQLPASLDLSEYNGSVGSFWDTIDQRIEVEEVITKARLQPTLKPVMLLAKGPISSPDLSKKSTLRRRNILRAGSLASLLASPLPLLAHDHGQIGEIPAFVGYSLCFLSSALMIVDSEKYNKGAKLHYGSPDSSTN